MVLLACLMAAATAVAEQPLSEDDVTLLLLGGASQEKIISLVNQRGIDFQMTPDLAKKFQQDGASAEVIQALRKASEKSSTAPPGAPPSPPAAAPTPPVSPPSPAPAAGQTPPQGAGEAATEQKVQEILQELAGSAPDVGPGSNAPIAPPLRLKEIFGSKLTPVDYQGKVVLVNFWATWCQPCRSEIPAFVKLQDRYRGQGFQVVGIAMDKTSAPVKAFYTRYHINYPVAMGDQGMATIYGGTSGLPTSFLIGRDGRIYSKITGAFDAGVLEARIQGLLTTPASEEAARPSPGGGSAASPAEAPASSISSQRSAADGSATKQKVQEIMEGLSGKPGGSASATKPAVAVDLSDPTPEKIQQIIQEFAQKEKLFKEARNNYTYHQINKVEELGPDNEVEGVYEQEWDILFDDAGQRIERVTYAPADTLKKIMVTKEDLSSMRSINPFVLTSDEVQEYEIKYLGHVKVDEITAYVFSIRPKEIKKGQQYFQGIVWVDDRDLQIVKSEGKPVPEVKKGRENLFPRFTTYREQIDGKFWFPTYTIADDTLYFSTAPVHIKQIIRYTSYKQYKASSTVKTLGELPSSKPESPSKNPPPKPQ